MNDILNLDWSHLMWWTSASSAVEPIRVDDYANSTPNPTQLRGLSFAMLFLELFLSLYLHYRQYVHLTSDLTRDIPQILSRLGNDAYKPQDYKVCREHSLQMIVHNAGKKVYLVLIWMFAIYFNWIHHGWMITNSVTMIKGLVDPVIERNVLFTLICYLTYETLILIPTIIHLIVLSTSRGVYKFQEFNYLVYHYKRAVIGIVPFGLAAGIGTFLLRILDSRSIARQVSVLVSIAYLVFILFPSHHISAILKDKKHVSHFEKSDLKKRLGKLCEFVGFPRKHLCLLRNSQANDHSTAFYFGSLWFHRIGLFNRIIEGHSSIDPGKGLPSKQVEAILAHELGHWNNNHSNKGLLAWYTMCISTVTLMYWVRSKRIIYYAFGFPYIPQPSKDASYAGIEIIPGTFIAYFILLRGYHYAFKALLHFQQHYFEKQADKYSAHLGYTKELEKGLIQLAADENTFPSADLWYSLCYHNHPSLVERLLLLEKYYKTFKRNDENMKISFKKE